MANILKRSLNLFLCLALVLSMMSAVTLTAAAETTTQLLLNTTYAKLKVNENETLDLKAVLKNGTAYTVANVTWKSTETGVATVSNGTVTPVATGTTLITATTADGSVAKCTVDVYDSRLYFEEKWVCVSPSANISTNGGTLTAEYVLAGSLKDSATVNNTYDATNNNYGTEFATVNETESTVTFTRADSSVNGSGIVELVATAKDGEETVTAKCYISAGTRGLDANASLNMAVQTSDANQVIWKYGYKGNDNFTLYNTVNKNSITLFNSDENGDEELGIKGRIIFSGSSQQWYPGSQYPSVMVWKAPKSGTVTVTRGTSYKNRMYKSSTATSGTTTDYFSAKVEVLHDGVIKYSKTYEPTIASTAEDGTVTYNCASVIMESGSDDMTTTDALKNISVKKGDEIHFVLSKVVGNPFISVNASGFNVKYDEDTITEETETSFGVAEDAVSLAVGGEKTLDATEVDEYVSSNPAVATVENGTVTAVAEGEAVIYALNADGSLADYCTVTVNNWGEPTISGSTVSIEAKSETVKNSAVIVAVKNGSGVLQKAYIAEYADNKFTASNVAVASGDSVTVFLWESLNTLKPLKAAIPVATN